MTQSVTGPAATVPLTAEERAALAQGELDFTRHDLGDADPIVVGARRLGELEAGSLTFNDAVRRLGITREQLDERLAQGQLYWFHGSRGGTCIPAFQFAADGEPVPGIDVAAGAIPFHASPTAVADWFGRVHTDLFVGKDETPVSPLNWLNAGRDPAEVAKLVAADFEEP